MVSATPVSEEPPTLGRQPFAAAGTAERVLSAWGCRPTFDGRKDDQRRGASAFSLTTQGRCQSAVICSRQDQGSAHAIRGKLLPAFARLL